MHLLTCDSSVTSGVGGVTSGSQTRFQAQVPSIATQNLRTKNLRTHGRTFCQIVQQKRVAQVGCCLARVCLLRGKTHTDTDFAIFCIKSGQQMLHSFDWPWLHSFSVLLSLCVWCPFSTMPHFMERPFQESRLCLAYEACWVFSVFHEYLSL